MKTSKRAATVLALLAVAVLAWLVLRGEGRPLTGATVRAYSAAKAEVHRQGTTDESGRYRVEGLDPGEWRVDVQVVGRDGFCANVAHVAIRAGENALDVRLGRGDLSGEIRGRVFSQASSRLLSSKEVQLALLEIQPDGSPRYAATAFADGEGAFRFPFLRGGRYRLLAVPMSGGLARKEIDLACAPGEKVAGVEVALDGLRTGKVRFTVRDPEGKPVRLVSILSLKDGKQQQGSMSANSQDGVYETHFEVGTHMVTIGASAGRLSAATTVEVQEGETTKVDVVLQPKQEEK